MKKNLTYIVSIAWQKTSGGNTEIRLRTSIYLEEKDNINSMDEAYGRALREQKDNLVDCMGFVPLVYNTATTWQEDTKPNLSCLRYC